MRTITAWLTSKAWHYRSSQQRGVGQRRGNRLSNAVSPILFGTLFAQAIVNGM